MLTALRNNDCSSIQLFGKELEQALQQRTLMQISIESYINCCTDIKYTAILNFTPPPLPACSDYTVTYCTGGGKVDVEEFNIYADGEYTNILTQTYDLSTSDGRSAFILEVQGYLTANFSGSSVSIQEVIGTDCYDIVIVGLPSGVVPQSIILQDPEDSTCYNTNNWICNMPDTEDFNGCVWTAEIDTQTEVGPTEYMIAVLFQDESNLTPYVVIDDNKSIINEQADIIAANPLGDLTITSDNDKYTFTYQNMPAGVLPYAVLMWNASGCITHYLFNCESLIGLQEETSVNTDNLGIHGCFSTPSIDSDPVVLESDDLVDFRGHCIALGPEFYNQTGATLQDGIYTIKVNIVTEDQKFTQMFNVFINCNAICKVVEITDIDMAVKAAKLIELTEYSTFCNTDCDCEQATRFYGYLLKTIDDATNTQNKLDCGQCS